MIQNRMKKIEDIKCLVQLSKVILVADSLKVLMWSKHNSDLSLILSNYVHKLLSRYTF